MCLCNALHDISHNCLLLKDRGPPDLEGAVRRVRQQGDEDTANLWQEALDNLTMGTPGALLSPNSVLIVPVQQAAQCCVSFV